VSKAYAICDLFTFFFIRASEKDVLKGVLQPVGGDGGVAQRAR